MPNTYQIHQCSNCVIGHLLNNDILICGAIVWLTKDFHDSKKHKNIQKYLKELIQALSLIQTFVCSVNFTCFLATKDKRFCCIWKFKE